MSINYSEKYDKLLSLDVELEDKSNPSPTYISSKLTECSNAQSEVHKMLTDLCRQQTIITRESLSEKMKFDHLKREALTNDEKIKKLPTIKEREAAVESLLEDNLKLIQDYDCDLNDIKSLLMAIKSQIQLLRSKNADIKCQQKVMETQVYGLNILPDDPETADLRSKLSDLDKLADEIDEEEIESEEEEIETKDLESNQDPEEDNIVDVLGEEPDEKISQNDVELDISEPEPKVSEEVGQEAGKAEEIQPPKSATTSDDDLDVSAIMDDLDGISDDTDDLSEQKPSEVESALEDDTSSTSDEHDDILGFDDMELESTPAKAEEPISSEEEASVFEEDSDLDISLEDAIESPVVESKKGTTKEVQEDDASISSDGIDLDDLLDSVT